MADIPFSDTSVYEAVYNRRMAWRYKDEPVSRETIQRMLDAAVWAPNHRLTEPWRFFVMDKDSKTREKVAEITHEFSIGRGDAPERAAIVTSKVTAPPWVVFAYSVPGRHDEETEENYASTVCACYIMSLVGQAEGLTVTWETGGPTRPTNLAETLGADPDWKLVSLLCIGAPDESVGSKRTPAGEFTSWLD